MKASIIPFEYMKLDRAAKFFNCEVDDFFHWYNIGLINISLDFDDLKGSLLTINGASQELPPECVSNDVYSMKLDYRDEISSFVCESIRLDQLAMRCRVHGVAGGIWVPCQNAVKTLRERGSLRERFWAAPYHSGQNYRAMIEVTAFPPDYKFIHRGNEVELDIHEKDCWPSIKSEDLILYKHDLVVINKLLNGEMTSKSKSAVENDLDGKTREHITQFAVICQLLKMVGLTNDDVYASSPTQLQKTLEQKATSMSLSFPSVDKNTWTRWRAKFPTK